MHRIRFHVNVKNILTRFLTVARFLESEIHVIYMKPTMQDVRRRRLFLHQRCSGMCRCAMLISFSASSFCRDSRFMGTIRWLGSEAGFASRGALLRNLFKEGLTIGR